MNHRSGVSHDPSTGAGRTAAARPDGWPTRHGSRHLRSKPDAALRRQALFATALAAALWVAGCAQVAHVATGQVVVGQRMMVDVDKGWNQFQFSLDDGTPTWTQEGVTVDALKFYVAKKDGELIAPTPSEPKGVVPLAFKSGMQAADVIVLYEKLYSRGGSTFKLEKVIPDTFVGVPGYRFEFSSIRKSDDLRLRGVAWFAVRNGELWAITYTAPRLAFFDAGIGGAETIARSARITL